MSQLPVDVTYGRALVNPLEFSPADARGVLAAYGAGWFMMDTPDSVEEGLPLRWRRPKRRAIIPLGAIRIPPKVARLTGKLNADWKVDTAFEEVLEACAQPRGGTSREVWLTPRIQSVYGELYELGYAHSCELWVEGQLVAGILGIALGGAFFDESHFHRISDTGHVCTAMTLTLLRELGYQLYDVQVMSPYLERFGAVVVSGEEFEQRLGEALIGGAIGAVSLSSLGTAPSANACIPAGVSLLCGHLRRDPTSPMGGE